jgi:hypothetical protein
MDSGRAVGTAAVGADFSNVLEVYGDEEMWWALHGAGLACGRDRLARRIRRGPVAHRRRGGAGHGRMGGVAAQLAPAWLLTDMCRRPDTKRVLPTAVHTAA